MESSVLILASASPRRAQILQQLQIPFEIQVADIDESIDSQEDWRLSPLRLASAKALAVSAQYPNRWIIGADTLVFTPTAPLGKPSTRQEAADMLLSLSGTSHYVSTGIALVYNQKIVRSAQPQTKVIFREIPPQELEKYLDTLEWTDKAGAYGIQGFAARFIRGIEGCFYNVMGLPVEATLEVLGDTVND